METQDIQAPTLSIRALSVEWSRANACQAPLPLWLLGDFVDDFRLRARTAEDKMALVLAEPECIDDASQESPNTYWAAMVETLCREAGLQAPGWTEQPRRYLHRPWFAGQMENLKAVLLAESPIAFRRRNLFVSANVLARA